MAITQISATADTAEDGILEYLRRDGVVIVTGMLSRNHLEQVKQDLAPHFDSDVVDESGFFPSTTQRATGLFRYFTCMCRYGYTFFISGCGESCAYIDIHFLYWLNKENCSFQTDHFVDCWLSCQSWWRTTRTSS